MLCKFNRSYSVICQIAIENMMEYKIIVCAWLGRVCSTEVDRDR